MASPNIVLIMTDQQRWDSLGYAHGGPSYTPNLDRLARSGAIFDNAYSSAPVCVPARSSLLTGLLPHRVRRAANGLALAEGEWTIARAFRNAGYETALFGKMHFYPICAHHGFDVSRLCEHLTKSAGYDPDDIDDYREWLQSTGRKDDRFSHKTPRVFSYSVDYHPTNWITREAIQFLKNRDAARPYFVVVSYPHPHSPYDPPEPYASMYPTAAEVVPSDGLSINKDLPTPFRGAIYAPRRPKPGYYPARVREMAVDQVKAILAAIRALVKQIDDAVAELVQHVDLSNTVVFFTSDHGDYGGHRGLMGKVPWITFDDLAKVALFCFGSGVKVGIRVSAPVQSFDFCSTALELAGVPFPSFAPDSVSLVPVLNGAPADAQRPVFCATGFWWPMIRIGDLKLVFHEHTKSTMLYDLSTDPGEAHDLSGLPEYAAFVAQARARLVQELARPVVA